MKILLEGCKHVRCETYGGSELSMNPTVTCLSCYRRLRAVITDLNRGGLDRMVLVDDYPPGLCDHLRKKPLAQYNARQIGYTSAMCLDCGRVLTHPDGPGHWEDAIFYGYLIKEEASWSSAFG